MKSPAPGQLVLVSIPIPGGDPANEALLEQTYRWLDEVSADFERQMGFELGGGNGVFLAYDVLVELHGRHASWAQYDVAVFERWVRAHAPDLVHFLPSLIAELGVFTNYQCRHGRMTIEQAESTERRMIELVGPAEWARAIEADRQRRSTRN